MWVYACYCVFFQAEDGIRDLVRSRGLGDVYKRQSVDSATDVLNSAAVQRLKEQRTEAMRRMSELSVTLSLIHI